MQQGAEAWDRLVRERVGGPLRPEALRTLLVIVPAASGDVALATTVVRYVKDRSPHCRVAFATRCSNFPLLAMCPGVDEAVEVPTRPPTAIPSRRNYLDEHAGRADAVIYPVCIFEDVGLLRRHNFLETMWLLAGIPHGMPEAPQAIWLTPPPDASGVADRVLGRCLGRAAASRLAAEAVRYPGKMLRQMTGERKLRNVGWKNSGMLLRHAAFVRSLPDGEAFPQAGKQFVIVSSEASSVSPPPPGLFGKIIRHLRSQGRIVLHNVRDAGRAAPGTVPLVCSYEEFVCLRAAGVPFVGWRSGLCDIAAASQAPMCVLYPTSMVGCSFGLQANCESPLKSFGFHAMNIAARCTEIICDEDLEPDLAKLGPVLE